MTTSHPWGVTSLNPASPLLEFEEHGTADSAKEECARRALEGHMGVTLWFAVEVDGKGADAP